MPSQRARQEEGGRKLRALALHGAASNSSIMRFQCSQLRRYLGSDVEWFFPDAPVPHDLAFAESGRSILSREEGALRPAEQAQHAYFQEPSDFEKRLSQGKPFRSWFIINFSDHDGTLNWDADLTSVATSVDFLAGYIESNAPIHIAVAWSQGCYVLNTLAARCANLGLEVPWRMSIQFSPTAGTAEVRKPIERPFFKVISPADQVNVGARDYWDNLYSTITEIEHDDGFAFPTTQPRAQEIYQRLAFEVRYHCMDESEELEVEEPAATADKQPRADVPEIEPQQVAKLLLEGSCAIVDARAQAAAQARPFPGARLRLGCAELRLMHPLEARRQIVQLQEGSSTIVVVAEEEAGESCREYCALLVRLFGFQAERLRCLAGGLHSWSSWELDNQAHANKVRQALGMPLLRGADIEAIKAEELAELLLSDSCVVLDAREPRELRRSAFPGALKDLGLLALQRRPQHVEARLAGLPSDGRRLVAVSVTGARCRQYCAALVGQFGLPAERLCWLDGGIRSWDDWALEHWEASDAIRARAGLSPTRGRPLVKGLANDDGGAAQREYSLGFLS